METTIFKYAKKEWHRQKTTLSLIASENIIYKEALQIAGFPLSSKYSEGYPGRRFYAGCENIDSIELCAIEKAKSLFNCKFANVQCYSGSIANFAIYKALLNQGDPILSMEMSCGGHLTHSSPVSFVSSFYRVFTYSVDRETLRIDYEEVKRKALEVKPKLIIAGASSYPYRIDFKAFREIADLVGAYLLADICHLSAFIAKNFHPHCFPHAHVAMLTMHKQLRSTRGAVILWNDEELTDPINKSVFPGLQGGMNPAAVAVHAIALEKALSKDFEDYVARILDCANYLVERFNELGIKVVGGSTETHMLLIDVKETFGMTGKQASDMLEKAGIMTNPNLIPFDTESPFVSSGIRIGTLSMSVLKFSKGECYWLADQIVRVLKGDEMIAERVKREIASLLRNKHHEW